MNLKQKVVGTAHLLIIAMLASFVVLVANFPASAITPGSNGCELTGAGTDASPYLISNSLELREAADCDGSIRVFEVVADLVISASEAAAWPQLGTYSNPFNGTVRGNVAGKPRATITIEAGGELRASIFGATANVTISDLVVVGDVGVGSFGNVYVGAFAQIVRSGTTRILNSLTYVNVSGPETQQPSDAVGSFVGEVLNGNLIVQSSSAVASAAYGTAKRGAELGGLVGYVDAFSTVQILSSSAYVHVSDSNYELGGLIGRAQGEVEIQDSFFMGSLSQGDLSYGARAGGLVGGMDGSSLSPKFFEVSPKRVHSPSPDSQTMNWAGLWEKLVHLHRLFRSQSPSPYSTRRARILTIEVVLAE